MNCERIKQLLSAYLDKELSGTERKQTKEHLESCPKCSQEVTALQKVANLVSSLPKVSAPYGLAQRVQHQLLKPQPSTEAPWVRFLFRYRWALGGVVTTAAALMIVYINIVLLSKPATVTEPERPTTPKSVATPSTPPSDDAGMETGGIRTIEEDTSTDALARKEAGLDRLSGMPKAGLSLKHSEEESPRTISKKGSSESIGKGGMAADGLEHKERKQQTIEPTLAQKLELPELMNQTEERKASSLLSQEVLVACADLDTQVSELEKIVKNTLNQIPKAQVTEVTGNAISILNVPSDKQIQSQITQLKSNINSFRQQQKSKANTPLQIKVSIPLEQKEHLIAQLDRLGQVQVSQLKASQPGDLRAGKLGNLALDLQEQINDLTENAQASDRRGGRKYSPDLGQSRSTEPTEESGVNAKAKQYEQASKDDKALTQIEKDTIKLYDLKLQRAAREKQSNTRESLDKSKKRFDQEDTALADEQEKSLEAEQMLEPQRGFTSGRPSQTVMIELIITLEEQTNVIPTGK